MNIPLWVYPVLLCVASLYCGRLVGEREGRRKLLEEQRRRRPFRNSPRYAEFLDSEIMRNRADIEKLWRRAGGRPEEPGEAACVN